MYKSQHRNYIRVMRRYRLPPFSKYPCLVLALWVVTAWSAAFSAENSEITPFSLAGQYSQLSREELREIFFGRQTRWPDGSPLRVFVLPDQHPIHIRFAKEVLGIYPYQLRSAWDRMLFSGTGTPPVIVESPEQMQTELQKMPNAIGYIVK